MAISTVTTAVDLLKNFYLEPLRVNVNEQADPAWAQFERNTEVVEGDQVVLALRYGRTGGVGFRDDDGDLPTANSRKTKQAKFPVKNLFGRIQLTSRLIKASRSSMGAFAKALETEMDEVTTDLRDTVSRAVYGDGTGKLSGITAASWASNVLTLTVYDNIQYFAEGMLLDIYDVSAGTALANGSGLEVTAVDVAQKQVQLSTANNIAAGIQTAADGSADYLVLSGSYGKELTGLQKIFTPDNVLYGIDRSTNKWFNPQVKALNGEISEDVIQEVIDQCETFGGSRINLAITSKGVRRKYIALLRATKQHVNTLELKGGWSAIGYQGGDRNVAIIAGKYAPAGRMYLLDLDDVFLALMSDFNFMDDDGATLSRVSGKAAYEATVEWYGDICNSRPRGSGVITGITE